MQIDTALLRRASLANLERLARAMGVDVVRERRRARRSGVDWHWALCVVLARRLRQGGPAAQTNRAGVVVAEVEVTDE